MTVQDFFLLSSDIFTLNDRENKTNASLVFVQVKKKSSYYADNWIFSPFRVLNYNFDIYIL